MLGLILHSSEGDGVIEELEELAVLLNDAAALKGEVRSAKNGSRNSSCGVGTGVAAIVEGIVARTMPCVVDAECPV
jgi:hypothetical protein